MNDSNKMKFRTRIKNLRFLFARSWRLSKSYFLLCLVKNLFSGLMPLVNVFGVGIIVDALLAGKFDSSQKIREKS